MSIFKACDIRGIVGEEWTAADARRIGRGLGRMFLRRAQAVACVGGDFRRSTPELKQAVTAGLRETGISVLDVGQAATPVVYFAGRYLRCPNVVVVTASHNAGPYNGVKFLMAGRPATPDLMQELQARLDEPATDVSSGECTAVDVVLDYERWVLRQAGSLATPRSTAGALRVAVDAMSGAMTNLAPRVLAALGCKVVSLGDHIDPDYSCGAPNPARDASLQPLIERVLAERADLGVALDGDGDRVIFVDHGGGIVRPEQIGALLAVHCFERPKLVYDLKCASVLARAVEAAGGTALMRPSGHGFIKATMVDGEADLGVEVSGHHFYGVLDGGDDGLLTALIVCRLLASAGRSLGDLIAPFPWPAITPDIRIPFTGDAGTVLETIANQCGGEVTRLDGVRAQYDDGWALARASITEPAVTFRFEGRDWGRVPSIVARFLAAVPELRDEVRRHLAT